MKKIQFFFTLLFFVSAGLCASDGDQKKDAQSLHEQVSRTISIDMSAWGWGHMHEFPENLKDSSQPCYTAIYATYLALKEFYSKQFASTDPELKNTAFLLVNYSYNPDAELKEFHNHLPSRDARTLIYAYANIEDPLKLPRVVPLTIFKPKEEILDARGELLTPAVFQHDGDIAQIATEHGIIPMKIKLNDKRDRDIAGELAFLGNVRYLRHFFDSCNFNSVADVLRTNPRNTKERHMNWAIEVLKDIPRFQPLVCAGDYSDSTDHNYISEILRTNKMLTDEQRKKLQAKYDHLIAEEHTK